MRVRQAPGPGREPRGSLQGLVWIAKIPQGPGCIARGTTLRGPPHRKGKSGAAGIVEGNSLLQVRSGRGQLPKPEQGCPQRMVGLQRRAGSCTRWARLRSCSASSRAVCNSPRIMIKNPQSPQHWEELRCLAHLLAQLPRPGVGSFHFWGSISPWWPSGPAQG